MLESVICFAARSLSFHDLLIWKVFPGRLTLTNYALYFEASNAITYDNALKIDLSDKDVDHKVSPASTGPWGAPLFDKAMIYESSLL